MPEAALVILLIAFPLVGAALRRWQALLLPTLGWPVFYVGLDREWWGRGTGDGWEYAAILVTTLGVASTAAVVAAAQRASNSRSG